MSRRTPSPVQEGQRAPREQLADATGSRSSTSASPAPGDARPQHDPFFPAPAAHPRGRQRPTRPVRPRCARPSWKTRSTSATSRTPVAPSPFSSPAEQPLPLHVQRRLRPRHDQRRCRRRDLRSIVPDAHFDLPDRRHNPATAWLDITRLRQDTGYEPPRTQCRRRRLRRLAPSRQRTIIIGKRCSAPAARNRLIAFNPGPRCPGPEAPQDLHLRPDPQPADAASGTCSPRYAERHRALIATAADCRLPWGEVAGLMDDGLDLDAEVLRVIRTGARILAALDDDEGDRAADARCCLFAASILLRMTKALAFGSLRSPTRAFLRGRYWDRTSDLFGVNGPGPRHRAPLAPVACLMTCADACRSSASFRLVPPVCSR